jgi:hypothetical protein
MDTIDCSFFRLSFDTFSLSLSWCAATEPLLFRALRWTIPKPRGQLWELLESYLTLI